MHAWKKKLTINTNAHPVINVSRREEHTYGRAGECLSFSNIWSKWCEKISTEAPFTLWYQRCVQIPFRETQRKNKKLLSLEILSLKPSEEKTKMYFLKQYFQQKKTNKTKTQKRRSAVWSLQDETDCHFLMKSRDKGFVFLKKTKTEFEEKLCEIQRSERWF